MKDGGAEAARGTAVLLAAVAAADRDAFRALYDRAAPKLFGIALRICKDRELAEDALQDAFVEIWRRAGRFDPARGGADAWMAVIARNRAIDALRRRGAQPGGAAGPETDERLLALADPASPADGGAEYLALVQCLGRLEDREREAVLLAYYAGATRDELAGRYDAPVPTVKTWLRRALAALRACLDG